MLYATNEKEAKKALTLQLDGHAADQNAKGIRCSGVASPWCDERWSLEVGVRWLG